jgi:formate hydrogenlyase subunit 3/multisubunit Na+/H+ antiporter MnhD subunit
MADHPLALLIWLPLLAGLFNLMLPRLLQKLFTVLAMIAGIAVLFGWHPDTILFNATALNRIQSDWIHMDNLSNLAIIAAQVLSVIICIFSLKGIDPKIERKFFILFPSTL